MTYLFRVLLKPKGPPLFQLGRLVATPGAIELMVLTETSPLELAAMHVAGDWGECDPEDAQTNNEAVKHGARVMSVYRLPLIKKDQAEGTGEGAAPDGPIAIEDDRIWVITEADRSVTTFLLPEEY
ncbi:type I restriction endonuclease subunit M [Variovorax sp. WS11]|uniref:type I restriction endonuclease subunit M n=1 Tax=Variovorax sp. WS11 TaxID=1105204 RepID=UPI000D0E0A83|nr:type I restriction endonuclease subunit M [Variovorax sp. WS11]NDZ12786.1 type I restriction endonuclease subunit M [Variovorax sp. WS11]PSL84719.1 type I restriction endonuclease subunit M [Variovorax sp. WS11]